MRLHEAIHLARSGRAKYIHHATGPKYLFQYDQDAKYFVGYYKWENKCISVVQPRIRDLRNFMGPSNDSCHWDAVNENYESILKGEYQ